MSGAPEEMVDWIDEEDRVLASLPRPEVRRRNLLHRVTGTLVFHPDGRVFVHQRTATKDVYPGLHDVMVGGTVTTGEGFAENACREVAEELGVTGVPLYALFGHRYRDAHSNSLIRVFACEYGGPLTFQPDEVAGGAWTEQAEATSMAEAARLCPDSAQGWALFREKFPPAGGGGEGQGGAGARLSALIAQGMEPVGNAG